VETWCCALSAERDGAIESAKTKLIVSDGGGGGLAALERVYPDVPIQSCLSHRYRNVLKYTPYKHKPSMGSDLKKLTMSNSKEEFLKQVGAMQKRWQTIAPEAIKSLIWNVKLSVTYLDFPRELWSKLRTTNAIERTFREVRARTRVHYDHYESPESSNKYHRAVFGNINQTYFHVPPPSDHTH
jgi:transposase-like protein